ncbi:hypothetical protein VHEMI07435 [[Torrubiella] hemipterigena]|uniref:BHLH domain-containing protein n=1 Tax=[Torrubiella] hemipterigena TaxID=1531966 RepID=A0A0A1T3J8_9HYPO|nr:hypothetical protein VHEMI07435 [[Torrubiella] hemipterigena]
MSEELFSGVCFAKSLASCSPLSSTSWKKQKSFDWSASATKHIPSGQTELLSQALYPLSPSANAADQDLKLPGDASSPALVLPPSPTSILSSYARSQGEEHSSHSPSNSWTGSPLDPSMGERGASDSAAQGWTSTTTKSQNDSSQRENFALSYDKSFAASNHPSITSGPELSGGMYSTNLSAPYWYNSLMGGAATGTLPQGSTDISDAMDTEKQLQGSEEYPVNSNLFSNGINWGSDGASSKPSSQAAGLHRQMTRQSWAGQPPTSENPRLMPDVALMSSSQVPIVPSNSGPHAGSVSSGWNSQNGSSTGFSRTSTRKASVASTPLKKQRSHSVASESSSRRAVNQSGMSKDKPRSSDRTTHNDVERKYRMNLKDKIAELKAAVPSLQTASEGDSDGGLGNAGASKISKGTILSKATEYIHELEQVNRMILTEHHQLVQRVQQLESILQEGGVPHAPTQYGQFDPQNFP